MTASHKDQLLALGEKLKQDVKAAGKKRSDVFLSIWNGIEQNLLDKDFDPMSARDPKTPVELSLREGLVDIGRCYLAEDDRLPNDVQVSE
ncbi:hypothetical protein HF669_05065 [Acidithiobacillus thiooxidans]|uniref:hypothetical protein n=1 Tax=Acidithiobacillus thiooxidans TaxID=930 RepID=UPI00026254A1|nr:hypothetical protein [Acidithiobacillus thiooxidans]MBU2810754.1 hypothetical protein [Acidithiobacillus thiooxidans]